MLAGMEESSYVLLLGEPGGIYCVDVQNCTAM